MDINLDDYYQKDNGIYVIKDGDGPWGEAMRYNFNLLSKNKVNVGKLPTYPLTVSGGLVGDDCRYYKNAFSEVTVRFMATKSAGSSLANGTTVANLPEGFRPDIDYGISGSFHDHSTAINTLILLIIHTNGQVRLWANNIPAAPEGVVRFTANFVAVY